MGSLWGFFFHKIVGDFSFRKLGGLLLLFGFLFQKTVRVSLRRFSVGISLS